MAINRATWKYLKGKPSRNTFISKRDATLGYPSNRDLMTWRACGYRELLARVLGRAPSADEVTASATADLLSWYFQVITGEKGETHFITTPRLSGFQQKQIDFSHRTTSMGKREACRDGDFLTSKLRDIVAAKLEEKNGDLSLTWAASEVVPPSMYGLVDVISEEDIKKLREQQAKGLKNPKSFVHRTHEIFIRYRSGLSCPKSMTWMDDVAVMDRMKHCGLVMTVVYDFLAENDILLSTVNDEPIPSNDPNDRLIFLGFEFWEDRVGFAKDKWKSYNDAIRTFAKKPVASGAEIAKICGIMGHAAKLFPVLKGFVHILTHHVGTIAKACNDKDPDVMKANWVILLNALYKVHKLVRRAVWEGWKLIRYKSMDVAYFLAISPDARENEISVDSAPEGVGMVNHLTGAFGYLEWEFDGKSWGKMHDSSTAFEACGMYVAAQSMKILTEGPGNSRGVKRKIVRILGDNTGCIASMDYLSPKFRPLYAAANLLFHKDCFERGIIPILEHCPGKAIPADSVSRLSKRHWKVDLDERLISLKFGCLSLNRKVLKIILEFGGYLRHTERS